MGILSNIFSSKVIVESKVDTSTLDPVKNSIHQFKVTTLEGKVFDFDSLKGEKILIVNTASKCGLTPQYKRLQELHDKYIDEKITIVGFPANDFFKQEPGDNKQIGEFCSRNYGVSFPMMNKVTVKGKSKDAIYKFLTEKALNGVADSKVIWNFQKYLINENGFLELCISPKTSPTDPEIIKWIEA